MEEYKDCVALKALVVSLCCTRHIRPTHGPVRPKPFSLLACDSLVFNPVVNAMMSSFKFFNQRKRAPAERARAL